LFYSSQFFIRTSRLALIIVVLSDMFHFPRNLASHCYVTSTAVGTGITYGFLILRIFCLDNVTYVSK